MTQLPVQKKLYLVLKNDQELYVSSIYRVFGHRFTNAITTLVILNPLFISTQRGY